MSHQEDKGARPKEGPHRDRPTVDYKRMHEGAGPFNVTPGKNRRDTGEAVAALQDGSPGKDDFGSVSVAGSDLGHEEAEKVLHDLDWEIEALKASIREVNSQLKAASLGKEQKKRTGTL